MGTVVTGTATGLVDSLREIQIASITTTRSIAHPQNVIQAGRSSFHTSPLPVWAFARISRSSSHKNSKPNFGGMAALAAFAESIRISIDLRVEILAKAMSARVPAAAVAYPRAVRSERTQ